MNRRDGIICFIGQFPLSILRFLIDNYAEIHTELVFIEENDWCCHDDDDDNYGVLFVFYLGHNKLMSETKAHLVVNIHKVCHL